MSEKSQLELYLEDEIIDQRKDLDILQYWKGYELRYPDLARMAKDILAIPLSTVASEGTFSIGGKILDKYRNCLKSDIVEALVCSRDWLFDIKGIFIFTT